MEKQYNAITQVPLKTKRGKIVGYGVIIKVLISYYWYHFDGHNGQEEQDWEAEAALLAYHENRRTRKEAMEMIESIKKEHESEYTVTLKDGAHMDGCQSWFFETRDECIENVRAFAEWYEREERDERIEELVNLFLGNKKSEDR